MGSRFVSMMFLGCVLCFAGCGPLKVGGSSGKDYFEAESKSDLVYLKAADKFFMAIVEEDFEKAYEMMSDWAKTDVNPNQFMPEKSGGKSCAI